MRYCRGFIVAEIKKSSLENISGTVVDPRRLLGPTLAGGKHVFRCACWAVGACDGIC